MYHYVYKLEHMETREFYIGSRSCKCHPSMDSYKGSMLTWKADKNKLIKTIIKEDFSNRSEANLYESELIRKFIDGPLNMNFHIPGEKFHTVGMASVIDMNGNIFLVDKDDERILNGELKHVWRGKKHSDVSKKIMSDSAKNRKITTEKEAERRQKISQTMKGVPKSKDFCENMSNTRTGENNPFSRFLKLNNLQSPTKGKKYERSECPHCKRMIAKSVIHVAHLDNCKMKK